MMVGTSGIVVSPLDATELACGISKALALSSEEIFSMQKEAKNRVKKYYSMQKFVNSYELIYRKLIAEQNIC